MDERQGRLLAEIIAGVGAPGFVAAASRAVCAFSGFELSSVVLHGTGLAPRLMFEDLASIGCRTGIDNYVRHTHRANPMLTDGVAAAGICRASDFRTGGEAVRPDLRTYLRPAPDEELGFRTIGWPAGLEELGLYFGACGGIVELSLYRPRGRRSAPAETLHALRALRLPIAAAFERHAALGEAAGRGDAARFSCLSAREREVADLLLAGCSSEAIALRLGITAYTVKDHRKKIFRKLRVGSLAELFAMAAA